MLLKTVRFGLIATTLAAVSFSMPSVIRAQDALKYGDAVEGEVTDSAAEVEYTFTGAQGDLVVINVAQADESDLEMEVEVSGADGAVASSTEQYTSYSAQAAFEVPADGDYTVKVFANEEAGDEAKVGKFNLNISKPELLKAGASIDGTASSDATMYYELDASAEVTLTYTKTDGDFNPAVILNSIDTENSSLTSMSELNLGKSITGATLTIQPIEGRVILSVTEATFDFNFETVTADYTIALK